MRHDTSPRVHNQVHNAKYREILTDLVEDGTFVYMCMTVQVGKTGGIHHHYAGQLPGQQRWKELCEDLGSEDGPFTDVRYDPREFTAKKARKYMMRENVEDQDAGQAATDEWRERFRELSPDDLFWEVGSMRIGGKQKGETEAEAVLRMFEGGASMMEVIRKRPNTWRAINAARELQELAQAPTTSPQTRVLIIYGESGSGKTLEARAHCKANNITPRIIDSAGVLSSGQVWLGDEMEHSDECLILENFDYRTWPVAEFIKLIDHKHLGPQLYRRKCKRPLAAAVKLVIITSTDDPATWWSDGPGLRRYDEAQRRIKELGMVRHRDKPFVFPVAESAWPADEDIDWVDDQQIVALTLGEDEADGPIYDISDEDEVVDTPGVRYTGRVLDTPRRTCGCERGIIISALTTFPHDHEHHRIFTQVRHVDANYFMDTECADDGAASPSPDPSWDDGSCGSFIDDSPIEAVEPTRLGAALKAARPPILRRAGAMDGVALLRALTNNRESPGESPEGPMQRRLPVVGRHRRGHDAPGARRSPAPLSMEQWLGIQDVEDEESNCHRLDTGAAKRAKKLRISKQLRFAE